MTNREATVTASHPIPVLRPRQRRPRSDRFQLRTLSGFAMRDDIIAREVPQKQVGSGDIQSVSPTASAARDVQVWA